MLLAFAPYHCSKRGSVASRFGLVNTMVFTHVPSNVLLILVPIMPPTLSLAVLVLFLRFSISQMDVPTRQSYTMAIVRPQERSATAGITGVARTTGSSVAPLFAGFLLAGPRLINLPFFIAGLLKIAYDVLLYREFQAVRPPEETPQSRIGLAVRSSPNLHNTLDRLYPKEVLHRYPVGRFASSQNSLVSS